MKLINPLKDIGAELNTIQAPSRYIGGEYGSIVKPHCDDDKLNYIIAFPDLYEIGMSNLAVKIIYNGLNAYENIRCERAFAPDEDFEALLKKLDLPLYSLETGMPFYEADIISFSIGYELGITQALAMMEAGKVSALCSERNESDPLVIAGGCGMTNPAPFGDFFDAVMIGEAEDGLFEMVEHLQVMKKNHASRNEMISYMESLPFIWTKNKPSAKRAVQADFGLKPSVPDWFPEPQLKIVQDHGVVEIMRGCPNGCRFCHAGIYYRPTRVKSFNLIVNEIDRLVFEAGYREISLNSLSSADFPEKEELLDFLNKRYEGYNVSFQLPSLKVNSMSLGMLEKLNKVRKSGLTFAVETPEETWQLSLNKEVYAQHLESIIKEAKAKGWSSAKFYFMIGLPVGDYFEDNPVGKTEEEMITEFLIELQAKTRIQCNVNVGVFIPKPHTAYQWVKQITIEQAKKKIDYFYEHLPRGKFKLGRHNFSQTLLEGLMSRGDKRAGKVIYSAFKKGVRFDAWDDHLKENMHLWEEAFNEADFNVYDYIYRDWNLEEELPWDGVSLGPSKNFYKKEWLKSIEHQLTPPCETDCSHPCGICNKAHNTRVFKSEELKKVDQEVPLNKIDRLPIRPEYNIPILYRVLFSFERKSGAEYIAYLSQVEMFHKAILRSSLPFVFTTGFNPLPRLEFASPMTLGLPSEDEVASCYFYDPVDEETFIKKMNKVLPVYFRIKRAFIFPVTNLRKRESLSQGMYGGKYHYVFINGYSWDLFKNTDKVKELIEKKEVTILNESSGDEIDVICKSSDKKLRLSMEEVCGKKWFEIISAVKNETLASTNISGWTADDENMWRNDNKNFVRSTESKISEKEAISFFDLYNKIAKINKDLILMREKLTDQRIVFYEEHPDVKKKHQS